MAARSQTPEDYEGDEQPDYKLEYDGDETKKVYTHPALDGVATARFKNGDVYHGPYKEGKRHGPGGRYTFGAGGGRAYYEGDYVANRREGHGVHVTIDGARYEGQWRDNVREGKGTYTYPNGDTYVGQWLKHLKHGDGVYTYAKTKAHITGKWSAGQLLHGTWAMGSTRYTGPFSGGVPDGEGLFVRHDGRSFSGRFSEQKWMHDLFERPHHTALPPQPVEAVDVFKKAQRALDKSVWKVDHFESIYKLPKEIEGVPNYRNIEGFPIFGTGQPTYEGLQLMLEKIMEMQINETRIERVVWVNMRVEPVIYVNDHSFAPRDVKNLNENMELEGLSIQNLLALEERLTQRVRTDTRRRGGLHHYYRDTFAENPEDRKNTELTFDVKDLTSGIRSVTQAYEVLKEEDFAVDFMRVPIIDERAPAFAEFDALFSLLRELEPTTAVCFNCQMGKGRTTTGTVVATLIRRALDEPPEEEKEEHKDEELVDEDDGEGDDLDPEEKKARDEERARRKEEEKKEKEAKSDAPPDYKLGQYSVIMKLTRALGEKKGDKIKAEVDDAIDRCKQMQNLRECIWDTKINYERESTASRRGFWKRMSLNFLERYFYLIAFNAFIKDALAEPPAAEPADGSDPPPSLTFTKWVDDHKDLLALLGTRESGALAEFNWT